MSKVRSLNCPKPLSGGFTFVELVIVVLLIGIFSSILVPAYLNILNRERLNSVALGLAGWIESVRNYSARQISNDPTLAGCSIEFLPSSSASSGSAIARIDNSKGGTCVMPLNEQSFLIPSDLSSKFSFVSVNQAGSANNSLIFTPRGIWISSPVSSGGLILKILQNNGGPMRCLKVSEFLGDIEIGSVNSKVITASCDNYEAF